MSSKKKIAILNFDISDNSLGRAYILARALSEDFHVEIIGPSKKGGIWEPLKQTDITIRELPYYKIPVLFFKLPSILRMLEADLIYAVKPRFTSFGFGLLKKWIHKKPLILDIDDWEIGFYLRKPFLSRAVQMIHITNPNGYFWTWLLHKFIKQADAITTVSTFLQKKYGGIIIPHAKDTELLNPVRFNSKSVKKELGWDKYKIVMFLGTPREHKGVEDALKAVVSIKEPDLRMTIVGANIKGKYEKKLRELGGERLLLVGKIPHHDVPKYLMAADIVVIPQRDTPDTVGQIPSKLFDAMAMAKPIITTGVSDIPEIVKDCAIITEPEHPEKIAQAIMAILNQPEMAKILGIKARERCERLYSFKVILGRIKTIIKEAYNKKLEDFYEN